MATYSTEGRARSAPLRQIRWATQKLSGLSGQRSRSGSKNQPHKGLNGTEKKRDSAGTGSAGGSQAGGVRANASDDWASNGSSDDTPGQRKIWFNIPLPDEAKDDAGRPLVRFDRNKIRTAKYTPLSFIPKNLWYQFHNIANVYFAFLVILAVSWLMPSHSSLIAY